MSDQRAVLGVQIAVLDAAIRACEKFEPIMHLQILEGMRDAAEAQDLLLARGVNPATGVEAGVLDELDRDGQWRAMWLKDAEDSL